MKEESFIRWAKELNVLRGKYGTSIKINDKYRCIDLVDVKARAMMGGKEGIHKKIKNELS